MAVKYLSGNRLWGTNAERLALTTGATLGSSANFVAGVFPTGASSVTTPTNLGNDYWVCLSDRLETSGVQLLPINSDFTIAFWIYPTGSVSDSQRLLSSGSGMHETWLGQESDGTFKMEVNSGGDTSRYIFPTGFSLNTWYLCVFTYDYSAGQITGYINNSAPTPTTNTTAARTITTTTTWRLLSVNTSEAEDYVGNMMELGIWNKILDSGERTALYDSGDGALANTIASGNLLAYYSGTDYTDPISNQASYIYPSLPNGSVFITSDTNVHYMWNGTDTWNEVA